MTKIASPPVEEATGKAVDAANPLANFASFSMDDDNAGAEKKDDVIIDNDPDNKEKIDKDIVKLKEEKKPEAKVEEVKKEEKKPEAKAEDPNEKIQTFEIPEDEVNDGKVEVPEIKDVSVFAKALNLPEPEKFKTIEDFKNHYETTINDLKKQAEDNKQTVDRETFLNQFDEKARDVVEFLDNGGDIEEFVNPTREVDSYLALNDEELLRLDLKFRGHDDSVIEQKIAKWIENDIIDDKASDVRDALNEQKEVLVSEFSAEQKALRDARVQQKQAIEAKKIVDIENALKKVDTFMGGTITDKHREFVANQYKSGKTRGILDNPTEIAEFLLYKTFSKQALKEVIKTEFQNGSDKIRDTVMNIPPELKKAGGSRTSVDNTPKKDGDFSAWEGAKDL
jgi:hypothetical protein